MLRNALWGLLCCLALHGAGWAASFDELETDDALVRERERDPAGMLGKAEALRQAAVAAGDEARELEALNWLSLQRAGQGDSGNHQADEERGLARRCGWATRTRNSGTATRRCS